MSSRRLLDRISETGRCEQELFSSLADNVSAKNPMPRHGGSNTASDARCEGVDPLVDLRDRGRVRVSEDHENWSFFSRTVEVKVLLTISLAA